MRVRIEPVAPGPVVTAVVPYIVLTLSWLSGAGIAVRDETVPAELHSTRMIVGNNLTIVQRPPARGAGRRAHGRGGPPEPVGVRRRLRDRGARLALTGGRTREPALPSGRGTPIAISPKPPQGTRELQESRPVRCSPLLEARQMTSRTVDWEE